MSKTNRKKSLYGIKNKISIAFLLFLILPIVILSVVSSTNMGLLGANVSSISGNALREEEIRSMEEITESKSQYIDEVFTKVGNDVNALAQYASDLFNGNLNISNRESYFHNDTTGHFPYDLSFNSEYNRVVSLQYSGWVVPYSNLADKSHYSHQNASMNFTLQTSAHLDSMFVQMKTTTPQYAWCYMGFEIGMHRSYPLHSYGNYDPRLRVWYQTAINNSGSVIYTAPYIDASGLGLMITAAKSVYYANGTLIGVVACDLTIETLKNNILNTKILDTGYTFLIDSIGNTVTHPNLTKINTPILNLESNSQEFQQLVQNMNRGLSGNGTFMKSTSSNSKSWYISYRPISSTNYTFAAVVPESEMIEPATEIQNNILQEVGFQISILLILLICAGVIIAFTINKVSQHIVKPITDLTKMMNFISQGDISREIPFGTEKKPDEITYLTASFKNLLTILRMGNEDYYRGDLNKAISNYRQAFEIFSLSENRQGMGVCYNNLGNIFRIRGDVDNARVNYEKAIEIAKELHDEKLLAKRLNNLAQLQADSKEYSQSQVNFDAALKIYDNFHDSTGMAQIYRNMGLMIAQNANQNQNLNMIEFGKQKIELAQQLDNGRTNPIVNAYNAFYLGKIAQFEGKDDIAILELENALQIAEKSNDTRLKLNLYKELEGLYNKNRDKIKAHQVRSSMEQLRISLMQRKFVVFVIDVSGSMQGPRIQAAIRGALEIYDHQINPQDMVSIIRFHSISEIILQPAQKGQNEAKIRDILKNIDATAYQTAFYDAVGDSFNILDKSIGNEHKWIIALTDGMDNSSSKFSLDDRNIPRIIPFGKNTGPVGLGEYIESHLLNLNLIIIGIGEELKNIEPKLKNLTARNEQGKYISVRSYGDVSTEIHNAFKEIRDLFAQINVEEFISD